MVICHKVVVEVEEEEAHTIIILDRRQEEEAAEEVVVPRVVALLILADAEEDGVHTMDHCRTMAIVRRDLITEQKAFLKVTNFLRIQMSPCVLCVSPNLEYIYITSRNAPREI